MKVLLMIMTMALATTATADEMAVTVYNSNLGVISETRTLDFDEGNGKLAFRDVPSEIDPASVRMEVLDGARVTLLEQNYAYDLVSPQQMYRRYIDQEIELIDEQGRLYSGNLLAYNNDAVTLMESSGRVKVVNLGNINEVSFPSLPEGLITRPTLFWLYASESSGPRRCRVGYQTSGMKWEAEYVGQLDSKEENLDLSGWSSITNNSGKTYENAKLKLVAGDIHRAQREPQPYADSRKMMTMAEGAGAGFEEKSFFEYHLYTLPRAATVANREIKQISLFDPAATTVDKVYTYRPDRNATEVEVAIEFTNSSEAGLGMPLPAGRVRLFKADDDGSVILLGEDRIDHTPRDEELRIQVGTAFDVVAEQKVMDQRRISQQVEERDFRIELRNRKESNVTVVVEKRLHGYWQVLNSAIEYTKEDAYTIQFRVPIEAGETRTFDFTVRFGVR